MLSFWPVPPSPETTPNEWWSTHKGATKEAIDALCTTPIAIIGGHAHPRPHNGPLLKEKILTQMRLQGFSFPMSWEQTQKVVYMSGPCKGCGAGILVDGQFCQGKYDGKRLPIIPDFSGKRRKNLKICRFCASTNHPIKLERKRRRDDAKELENTLMGTTNCTIRERPTDRYCTICLHYNTYSLTHIHDTYAYI